MSTEILALLELGANAQQVIECLEDSGHSVIACDKFVKAIAILKKNRNIGLVISDVHLENGGTVFDFLKWVKSEAPIQDIPFVLFSLKPSALAKYLEDGVKTAARLLGAAMYITMDKFDAIEFRQKIDYVLEKSGPK